MLLLTTHTVPLSLNLITTHRRQSLLLLLCFFFLYILSQWFTEHTFAIFKAQNTTPRSKRSTSRAAMDGLMVRGVFHVHSWGFTSKRQAVKPKSHFHPRRAGRVVSMVPSEAALTKRCTAAEKAKNNMACSMFYSDHSCSTRLFYTSTFCRDFGGNTGFDVFKWFKQSANPAQ